MRTFSPVKRLTAAAACIALCYVLPIALHPLGLGSALSPMHIPVLLCGLICGGWYGLFCGLAGPILSSVLSSMPPAAALVSMVPELMVYGLAAGLAMKYIRTKKLYLDLYICLLIAMVLGRIAGGIASYFVYLNKADAYGLGIWAASYITGTLPGIAVQLVLIPLLVVVLMKARVLPARYPAQKETA